MSLIHWITGGVLWTPSMRSWVSVTRLLNVRLPCLAVYLLQTKVISGQSPSQLNAEFADIRNNFNGRYVRLYGACDNDGF